MSYQEERLKWLGHQKGKEALEVLDLYDFFPVRIQEQMDKCVWDNQDAKWMQLYELAQTLAIAPRTEIKSLQEQYKKRYREYVVEMHHV